VWPPRGPTPVSSSDLWKLSGKIRLQELVRDVEVLCSKTKYPADFLVLGSAASKTFPIICGRPFLNTFGTVIDCKKEKILSKFDGESYEFNFSKFTKAPYETEWPNEDFRVEQLAYISLAPNDALQQYMEDQESEISSEERNEIDKILLHQPEMLKHNLPVENFGYHFATKGRSYF
jgi:hypothetical protein